MKGVLKSSLAAAAFFTVGAATRAADAEPLHLVDILRACVSTCLKDGVHTPIEEGDRGNKKGAISSTHDLYTFPETAKQAATTIELHHYKTSNKDKSYGSFRIKSHSGKGEEEVLRDHLYDFRVNEDIISILDPGPKDRSFSMTLSATEKNYNKVTKTTYDAAESAANCMIYNAIIQPFIP